MEKLKSMQNRPLTSQNYLAIWRKFNKFITRLDYKPQFWEDRTSLFVAHLIDEGLQSSTVKSYVSAIKRILIDDGYQWDDNHIWLTVMTKACRIINDKVKTRLPIRFGLLELILFEVHRYFMTEQTNQLYLVVLYQALFVIGYYGLLRVGEMMLSQHMVKAKNVHIAPYKEKIKLVLYTSKTHDRSTQPQEIKIISNKYDQGQCYRKQRNFCPFMLMCKFFKCRPTWQSISEPCFVFSDRSPMMPQQARMVVRQMLTRLGLNDKLYDMHSFHIGRCSDLINKLSYSLEEAKRVGRWKSSCVYHYIKN